MDVAKAHIQPYINSRYPLSDWLAQQKTHEQKLSGVLDDYLAKREQQHKDPVMDFLFEYYTFRPSQLRRWSPGFGVLLLGADSENIPELSEITLADEGAFLNPSCFPDNRRQAVRWILTVLEKSEENDPAFGCFGMHEWAMVYKKSKVRHSEIPLRMDKDELARFVESRPIVCTHFDAFRFFSAPARPLNKFTLSRETFADMEQPGCIHTNMDLYKWAFKLYPWISSSALAKAFDLALEARIVDMKASPYDLREWGLEPIKIETDEGRLEYLERQKGIYEKSIPVRERLIQEYRYLAECFDC